MYGPLGIDPFLVTPTTFIVSSEPNDEGWRDFAARFKQLKQVGLSQRRALQTGKLPPGLPTLALDCGEVGVGGKQCEQNMWIVKPVHLNCGRGISVFKELGKIKAYMRETEGEFVCQKYLEKPLLVRGRKFDIRVWVVVTDTFDIFVYREGYVHGYSVLVVFSV
jgi:hypothetical protein